jgi:formate hydrogenlyase subunit 6/NADH:ubiquinone oxidoreductase subunit I
MVKDEDLCVHCSLCAERCPTGAWDMQKSKILVPYAKDELSDEQALPAASSGS